LPPETQEDRRAHSMDLATSGKLILTKQPSSSRQEFDPDDLKKVEFAQGTNGLIQVKLYFRSSEETKAFEFRQMEQAIKFYEEIWSSRSLPSDDEASVKVEDAT